MTVDDDFGVAGFPANDVGPGCGDGVALQIPVELAVENTYALQITSQALNLSTFSGQEFSFDVAVLSYYIGASCTPMYCTKVASKLARTFTDRHGLKDICRDLLGVELSKQQQSSDWGAPELTPEQRAYAASDVLHLHALKRKLDAMLEREGRTDLAAACFRFLPARAQLDLDGWPEIDIFDH